MFHLYGLIIGVAIVLGWSLMEHWEKRLGKLGWYLIPCALVGARVYFVSANWTYFDNNLSLIWRVWGGGLSIWGGIIGAGLGYLAIIYFLPDLRLTIDGFAAIFTALPLSQAIGRLANYINHEFVQMVIFLPWWAMEAVLDLILFGVLIIIRKMDGRVRIGSYLVGYGGIRLFLSLWRSEDMVVAVLTVMTGVALIGWYILGDMIERYGRKLH